MQNRARFKPRVQNDQIQLEQGVGKSHFKADLFYILFMFCTSGLCLVMPDVCPTFIQQLNLRSVLKRQHVELYFDKQQVGAVSGGYI